MDELIMDELSAQIFPLRWGTRISARPVGPNEFPPDFINAFTTAAVPNERPPTIDLTLSDDIGIPQDRVPLGLGLGDTSDKPIELDLDSMDIEMASMTDLFGDTAEASEGSNGLFSPPLTQSINPPAAVENAKEQPNILADFNMDSNVNPELFGDFSSTSQPSAVVTRTSASHKTVPMWRY